MPFVEFDDVKPFIEKGLHATLMSVNVFNPYEEAAAIFIRDKTGEPIPADVADAPDWVNVPAAYIIQKHASALMSAKSEELIDEIEDRYQIALKILDEQRVKGAPDELVYGIQGAYTGVNE